MGEFWGVNGEKKRKPKATVIFIFCKKNKYTITMYIQELLHVILGKRKMPIKQKSKKKQLFNNHSLKCQKWAEENGKAPGQIAITNHSNRL